jgi:serine/threonine protein kinase
VHGDIKPGNVMIASDGRVVLLDFGLVSERAAPGAGDGRWFAGTPAYMAPEQLVGAPASEATDWYAFGLML